MTFPTRLTQAHNIADLRRLAGSALPRPILHYLEGGADDERTLARNTAVFDDWALAQSTLVDVNAVDTTADLLGFPSSMPLMLSPTGMSQLFHASGEMSVARAAANAAIPYGLSTMGTTAMETVATSGAMRYFQLYLFRDRGLTEALLERAAANGYTAIALTTDTNIAGNRERDLRTGMIMPPRFTLGSLLSFAMHPRWSVGAIRNRSFQLANIVQHVGDLGPNGTSIMDYVNSQFDRSASWKDLEWLRSRWSGKLVIKGAMMPADCLNAVNCGADAIMVSNHGGRQLDGTAAPLDYLPAIRDRVQNQAQLIVDGGVRRGTHVLKAIALGADGCSIGRPYLYGLAAGGQAGVDRALALFRAEIERGMALMGRTRSAQITCADIRHLSTFRAAPGEVATAKRPTLPEQSAGPRVR
ncbi:alpha-hydroxy acid oxidase [Novosphingobium sp. P6W]|uniref:alpha-hydroxy acid oxidase n=1 Tax=Novosphingobium sp. P6W TaxID=1609758 RepID=UPI0009E5F9F2|nr:alpha-hydroxy acid oxidase [Novosphingobium sp. P6W]AXB78840.1 alpha-hydroxy-acid oxidizing protein [Novosphingobium sp. P6W]